MTTLRRGSRGAEVEQLQKKLNLAADGIFGAITEEAVKDFQKSKGLPSDGVVGAKTWAALGAANAQSKRRITDIIIHCAATPEGSDVKTATIKGWHVAGRKWKDIGYHYVIELDGTVHVGRDESVIGAHTTGYNAHSIGVCYVGGCAKDGKTPKDTRTPAQKAAMERLVRGLLRKYPGARVRGHRDYSPDLNGNGTVEPAEWIKACPSFEVSDWLKETGLNKLTA